MYRLGDCTVAATETCLLRVIDPQTLETGPKIDLSSLVNIASARALTDSNGDTYNICGSFLTGLKYHFVRFEKGGSDIVKSAKILCSIPSRMKTFFSYYHSFGMSDRYLVMIEQPWIANSMKLVASKIKGYTFKDCLEWHPKEKNRFHVVEKDTGKVVKTKYISEEAFFFLNFVNVFEKGSELVVDVVAYDSPDILDQMYLVKLREGKFEVKDKSKVVRYVLPMVGDDLEKMPENENLISKVKTAATAMKTKEIIHLKAAALTPETGCEHPVINPLYQGKEYQYTYVIGWLNSINRGPFSNALTKIDLTSGELKAWRGDEFCHPAEPVFIPKPGSSSEDEGVLAATVTDTREDHNDFVVFIEAKNMTELARANINDPIPFTSHSTFFSQ